MKKKTMTNIGAGIAIGITGFITTWLIIGAMFGNIYVGLIIYPYLWTSWIFEVLLIVGYITIFIECRNIFKKNELEHWLWLKCILVGLAGIILMDAWFLSIPLIISGVLIYYGGNGNITF